MGVASTPEKSEFQRLCESRAHAAIEWLLRSIAACDGLGSATFYSRWRRPLRGWWWPYPETTGYIITTLLDYAKFAGRSDCVDVALRQADWITSLQADSGSLPGSHVRDGVLRGPSVFNTGQMIIGLVAAADHSGGGQYLECALRAARWLAGEVDDQAGIWKTAAYVKGHTPAYYTRVAWPMLEVDYRVPDSSIRAAAVRALDTIAGWRLANGAIRNWAFTPDAPAFTHTIAYTIRGFLESARLLGSEGDRFFQLAKTAADALQRKMELRGRLAGAYDIHLKGRYWYTCLAGNCQLALIWMKLHETLADVRYLNSALKAIQPVIDKQRLRHLDANVRGAVPGSAPFFGRYLTMRYPNWAAKFYVDSLMLAHRQLGRLLESGPCGSP